MYLLIYLSINLFIYVFFWFCNLNYYIACYYFYSSFNKLDFVIISTREKLKIIFLPIPYNLLAVKTSEFSLGHFHSRVMQNKIFRNVTKEL